ncbi:hypothetical protein G3O08_03920 [Cryomorpha ignava]|uniref:T9SS type A sorting domain-containing protein n=1 Tax=Cryomorpha ignava TaxID=101383 RepID=A0A7K3WP63_9FLAO|nr:hypothetical protein [Cryomorpha ignava]NEN22652.1 hypothetical protein [Cryomorpha ignava]
MYDLNTSSFVAIPTLTGIDNYRPSFIERFGDKMYLASDSYIGQLSNISNPSSLSFNSTFLSIPSGYGNAYGGPSTHFDFRYLLPDQVDMPYSNLAEMSCACCGRYNSATDKYEATNTSFVTWSPGTNPFGSVNGDVYISDELRIKAGAKVIISGMNFYFGQDAQVVIERGTTSVSGGYLRLSNGTVFTADNRCSTSSIASCGTTDNCDKVLWQGVRVQGNDALPQTLSTTSKQGQFYMTNNSMIEYAQIAVLAGGPLNYGGGLVQITDSRIKDNLAGVIFDPYTRYESGSIEGYNRGYISKTHFMTTSDWYGGPSVKPFVTINESSGIRLLGNLYENQIPSQFSFTQQGMGVQFTDSRVSITSSCSNNIIPCPPQNIVRSQFKDLHVGIYGTNTDKVTRTLYCHYNEFINDYFGVQLSGVDFAEILDNEFSIRPRASAIGLSLNASTGYMVENNNFSTHNGGFNFGNYGIVIYNSGETANEIYRNYFTDLSAGGYVAGINTDLSNGPSGYANGLEWICNTFDSNIAYFDIALAGSMSDEQGDCNTEPAGNMFSHTSNSIPSHFDLFSYPSALNPIKYYHHDVTVSGTNPRVEPLNYSQDLVTPIYYYIPATCNQYGYDSGSCKVKHSGLPGGLSYPPGLGKNNSENQLLTYQSIQENAITLQNQITELKAQIDGGNTDLLINLINGGGSLDEISALLAEANGNVSLRVQNALSISGDLQISGLVDEAQNDVSLIENELASAQVLYNSLWKNAVRQYMADTVGTLLKDEMESLMIEFQPEGMQRFASVLLSESEQGWIAPDDISQAVADIDIELPALINNALPESIPSYFESDFFASAANTDALNDWYYENGGVYYNFLPDNLLPPMIYAEGKSNKTNKELVENNTGNKLVVQPNPFKAYTTFDLSAYQFEGENNRIEFYDLLGKKVFETPIAEKQVNLIVQSADLPTGLVIYMLYMNNTAIETGKIIRMK